MINAAFLDKQRDKLYEVVKVQLHPIIENFNQPPAFGMYKAEGGDALGVVGNKFTPTQPLFLFDQFMASIQQVLDISLETLLVTPLKGGSKLKISCNVGKYSHKNINGEKDDVTLKLNIMTGYDGLTKTSLFLSTFRKLTRSTMKAWTTEYQTSFKNTVGNTAKINVLCDDITKVMKASDEYVKTLKNLSILEVTKKQRDVYVKKVLGISIDEYETLSTRKKNILDEVNEAITKEMEIAGKTAWSLLYGIARYTNKRGTERDSKNDFIFVDAGRLLNEKAQKEAFALIK